MKIQDILNELVPFKSNPAFKAVQDLENGEEDEGNTAYNPEKMETVTQQLGKLGWKPIGSGYWAKVFTHPSKPYVLKIFMDDPYYLTYLKIMQANQKNPHVPKIIGRPVKITPTVNAVRLEKLTPLTSDSDPIFKKYVDPRLPANLWNAVDIYDSNKEFAEKNQPQWVQLLKAIDPVIGKRGDIDLNVENVMKRGETLVLLDP